eukprot:scaffold22143_cov41-Cyclotella_meneghiniana.AAC.4
MADGVVNEKIQPKRTKAMDMPFHWLLLDETSSSKASQNIRNEFLTPMIMLEMLRQKQAGKVRMSATAAAAA